MVVPRPTLTTVTPGLHPRRAPRRLSMLAREVGSGQGEDDRIGRRPRHPRTHRCARSRIRPPGCLDTPTTRHPRTCSFLRRLETDSADPDDEHGELVEHQLSTRSLAQRRSRRWPPRVLRRRLAPARHPEEGELRERWARSRLRMSRDHPLEFGIGRQARPALTWRRRPAGMVCTHRRLGLVRTSSASAGRRSAVRRAQHRLRLDRARRCGCGARPTSTRSRNHGGRSVPTPTVSRCVITRTLLFPGLSSY